MSLFDSVTSIFGGGGGGSQAAPEADPSIKAAQDKIGETSGYGWDTFKNALFPQQQQVANEANLRATGQYGLQTGIATKQNAMANTAYDQANETMTPALQALKADAANYNEAGYREQMAGRALGDINTQFENQRNQTIMRNQAYGIDPTSGVAQGTQNANSVMQAAAGAAAMNQTRQAAYDLGLQKQQNLYTMGTNMVGMGNTATGLGLQASNSALTASQLPMANTTALGTNLNTAIQTNTAANAASGNLGLGKYQTQVGAVNAANQANATEAAGLGSLVGSGIGAFAALGRTAGPAAALV
jgi:hypothetical protein